jgi:8-oxo-dGTP diphosphatase
MKKIRLAGCLIFDDNGSILLIHRNTQSRTQWELPGGKIEEGEAAKTAAIRELRKELGVEVSIKEKVGKKSFVEDGHQMAYHWFIADIKKGTPSIREEKFDELNYVSLKELEEGNLALSANVKNLMLALIK